MEEDIRSYEAQNKTGNQVLDAILTGKNLYRQKHGIALSVIADGKLLAFVDVMDICTLVGAIFTARFGAGHAPKGFSCNRSIEDCKAPQRVL